MPHLSTLPFMLALLCANVVLATIVCASLHLSGSSCSPPDRKCTTPQNRALYVQKRWQSLRPYQKTNLAFVQHFLTCPAVTSKIARPRAQNHLQSQAVLRVRRRAFKAPLKRRPGALTAPGAPDAPEPFRRPAPLRRRRPYRAGSSAARAPLRRRRP